MLKETATGSAEEQPSRDISTGIAYDPIAFSYWIFYAFLLCLKKPILRLFNLLFLHFNPWILFPTRCYFTNLLMCIIRC